MKHFSSLLRSCLAAAVVFGGAVGTTAAQPISGVYMCSFYPCYNVLSAIAPIDIPGTIAPSATQAIPEIVEGHVLSILVATGRNGINPWHNVLSPLTWPWLEFFDRRSSTLHQVFAKDQITLKFADGSTVQAEMMGHAAPSGHYFRFLPDSIRLANGQPIAQLPSLPAAPTGLQLTPPWTAGSFGGTLPFGYCAFLNSHCEFVSGNAVYDCYFRHQEIPCG